MTAGRLRCAATPHATPTPHAQVLPSTLQGLAQATAHRYAGPSPAGGLLRHVGRLARVGWVVIPGHGQPGRRPAIHAARQVLHPLLRQRLAGDDLRRAGAGIGGGWAGQRSCTRAGLHGRAAAGRRRRQRCGSWERTVHAALRLLLTLPLGKLMLGCKGAVRSDRHGRTESHTPAGPPSR